MQRTAQERLERATIARKSAADQIMFAVSDTAEKTAVALEQGWYSFDTAEKAVDMLCALRAELERARTHEALCALELVRSEKS